MKDDRKLGVMSTALLFGKWFRPILTLFATGFVVFLAVAGFLNGQGLLFFLVSVLGSAAHVTWQLYTLDINNPSDCRNKFLVGGPAYLARMSSLISHG
jgi:4-hydroxybenzoate polyprenyltransferase